MTDLSDTGSIDDPPQARSARRALTWKSISRTLDVVSKVATIAVPFVIWGLGHDYEVQKDRSDKAAAAEKERADAQAATWARDTDYVHMLANPPDRAFAIAIITQLKKENRFPPDLQPVVDAMSQGRPGDKLTQAAAQIQVTLPTVGGPKPVQPAPPGNTGPISVFIQYASADQGCSVYKLEGALHAAGFLTPPAQHVAAVPTTTSVRYFSTASASPAADIQAVANRQGLHAVVQNFTAQTSVPLRQIEVWIGKNDLKANEGSVLQDEKGEPITDETGDALLDSNCQPFVVGVSRLG